MSDKAIEEIH